MKILQIGHEDWSKIYEVKKELEWHFFDPTGEGKFDTRSVGSFDVSLICTICPLEDFLALEPLMNPYTVLMDSSLKKDFGQGYNEFFKRMMIVDQDMKDPQELIGELQKKYDTKQFGQKLPVRKILVSPLHKEKVWLEGTKYLATNVVWEDTFRQLLFWKLSIPYDHEADLELWLEYEKEEGCSIQMDIQLIESGSPDQVLFYKRYSEEELAAPVPFSHPQSGYLACSVFAKGKGTVKIGAIHYRYCRHGAGEFLPGGKRLVDKNRQELFYYFHPGNLKPPFNIYFSDYRQEEGFEGYFMMKGLGHPFLLVSDPRLEGGAFYVGSVDLEGQLQKVIRECMDFLEIGEEDVIFSGLSMGAFGALYYGSKRKAEAIILGKPILDLDYVAQRTRLIRPNDFLTVLDIVKYWEKTDEEGHPVSLKEFTDKMVADWAKPECFKDTKLLMAYMEEDDYDDGAYFRLLKSQSGKETAMIARGYEGRHNDQDQVLTAWFLSQYQRVIKEYLENKA